jgi:hypothetical protein
MNLTLRVVGSVVLGALAGLAYQRLIGCRSGTCPITSNPYVSTIFPQAFSHVSLVNTARNLTAELGPAAHRPRRERE